MTHNVHPYAFRLGLIRDWKSRWFNRSSYAQFLKEDTLLREWLTKKLRNSLVESIEIERTPREFRLVIHTPRPGLIIGRGGEGIEKLKKEIIARLVELTGNKKLNFAINVAVEEVRNPEANATVVARFIAQDLERRMRFRRVLKLHIAKVMNARGVQGVRVMVKGRLDGAEMGRKEWLREGRIPLQTLRADIDFARDTATLPYGVIGIKVWIYRGEVFDKDEKKDK